MDLIQLVEDFKRKKSETPPTRRKEFCLQKASELNNAASITAGISQPAGLS